MARATAIHSIKPPFVFRTRPQRLEYRWYDARCMTSSRTRDQLFSPMRSPVIKFPFQCTSHAEPQDIRGWPPLIRSTNEIRIEPTRYTYILQSVRRSAERKRNDDDSSSFAFEVRNPN